MLGGDASIRRVARHAERAAEVECTVLISGETGTGKEVWARLVHQFGASQCEALCPGQLCGIDVFAGGEPTFRPREGCLYGCCRGVSGRLSGRQLGVVFLDEIGEMPLELQPKLLRVLQEQEVTPVGAATPVPIDVQVIAATNRRLDEEVAAGRFREDLYFRLNMVELKIPPLRCRPGDIPAFVEFFSRRFATRYRRDEWQPDAEELQAFVEFDWPGNVRQLSHVIEQAYVLNDAPRLPTSRSTQTLDGPSLPYFNLDRLRSTAVRQALQATGGHKGKAARLLGIHANTLTRLLTQIS